MEAKISDVLLSTHLASTSCTLVELGDQVGVRLARNRRTPFHILLQGRLLLESAGQPAMQLEPGDFVLIARGTAHTLRPADGSRLSQLPAFRVPQEAEAPPVLRFGDGRWACVLSGVIGREREPEDRMASLVPDIVRLPAAQSPGGLLDSEVGRTRIEQRCAGPGARAFVGSLAHLLFVETTRRWIPSFVRPESAYVRNLGMPQISAVLRLIDARPEAPWTLDHLAGEVGMSRSTFSERFRSTVGSTPLRYVAAARMARAADLLGAGISVAQVALRVGYESPAAFSRAYRRFHGAPPREHRS